jgi:uncharacterized protein (DUF4415 family)
MRLDSDVIAWLKADGRGYQTKANFGTFEGREFR